MRQATIWIAVGTFAPSALPDFIAKPVPHPAPVAILSVSPFGSMPPKEMQGISQREHLDESSGMLSDPIGDPLTVPNAPLFREASGETGGVLNHEGGDPCFGGPKNLPMLLAELFGDGAEQDGTPALCRRERSY